MEIILQESVAKLGKAGDVVKVANGYARNYLLPKGMAIVADKKNVSELERKRQRILAKAAKLQKDSEALAAQLAQITLVIPVRVGEGDKLYGSVTSLDISDAIKQKGYDIDRRKILLDEPIKTLGVHQVSIKLGSTVTATISVEVVPQSA
ncbi:MAG: 50S ribosomal protein L9 [Deltaproteobacteria bacterium]